MTIFFVLTTSLCAKGDWELTDSVLVAFVGESRKDMTISLNDSKRMDHTLMDHHGLERGWLTSEEAENPMFNKYVKWI